MSKKKRMDGYNNFALLLNDERFKVDETDTALKLRRLIISAKCYYMQQLTFNETQSNVDSIAKMTMLRNTQFDFRPPR